MNNPSCEHVQAYKNSWLRDFKQIYAVFIACNSEAALKAKAQHIPHCYHCELRDRLHACLYCAFVGCFERQHIHKHAHANKHYLAADFLYGYVYCFCCSDYKHDSILEEIAAKCRRKAAKVLGLSEPYSPWEPSCLEENLLKKNLVVSRINGRSYFGFRGLINLGNTCYMNSVIQVLVHTPILREYFLSDQHVCQNVAECIICEVSSVYQELYSGRVDPFTPCKLLKIVWTNNQILQSPEQQDAHEFFFSILNIMHNQLTGGHPELNYMSIVKRTFQGQTHADIIYCQTCQEKSTKTDPFWDISLPLDGCNEVDSSNGPHTVVRTDLEKCIAKYTTKQPLVDPLKICDTCKNNKLSYQHVTFQKLPVVVCFHLKRFSETHTKISKFVSFPEILDMTSYLCYHKSETFADGEILNNTSTRSNRYCLFAVVCHSGTDLSGGHYFAYVRQQKNLWFRCNDHLITEIDLEDVLKEEAYILFYHKRMLEYE